MAGDVRELYSLSGKSLILLVWFYCGLIPGNRTIVLIRCETLLSPLLHGHFQNYSRKVGTNWNKSVRSAWRPDFPPIHVKCVQKVNAPRARFTFCTTPSLFSQSLFEGCKWLSSFPRGSLAEKRRKLDPASAFHPSSYSSLHFLAPGAISEAGNEQYEVAPLGVGRRNEDSSGFTGRKTK